MPLSCRLLVGNKADMEEARQVTRQRAEDMARQQGAAFLETSARTGANIQAAFHLLAERILEEDQHLPAAGHGLHLPAGALEGGGGALQGQHRRSCGCRGILVGLVQ